MPQNRTSETSFADHVWKSNMKACFVYSFRKLPFHGSVVFDMQVEMSIIGSDASIIDFDNFPS